MRQDWPRWTPTQCFKVLGIKARANWFIILPHLHIFFISNSIFNLSRKLLTEYANFRLKVAEKLLLLCKNFWKNWRADPEGKLVIDRKMDWQAWIYWVILVLLGVQWKGTGKIHCKKPSVYTKENNCNYNHFSSLYTFLSDSYECLNMQQQIRNSCHM